MVFPGNPSSGCGGLGVWMAGCELARADREYLRSRYKGMAKKGRSGPLTMLLRVWFRRIAR